MITREEAVALLNNALVGNPEPWSPSEADVWDANDAPVVGIQSTRLFAAAPDLARTVVALYDERERLRNDARHEPETLRRLLNEAHELTMATILERDEARRTLDVANALALELRRLRAAEAPGTDDEAVAPWTCDLPGPVAAYWKHADPGRPGINLLVSKARQGRRGWVICGGPEGPGWGATVYPLALDAMRAAVPGSV